MTTQPGRTQPADTATAEPAPSRPAARPGIRALIDNATSDRLYGWAWDPARPARRLAVELRLAGSTVAAATADLARPDLAGNGIGDGCHAFELPLRPEWVERRGELSAVVRCEDGAEVPVPVRVRRPDDAKAAARLQRAVEGLAAEQAALRREVADRPDPAAGLRERLDQLELWVARLDARLGGEAASPPKTGAGGGGGGLDPWQAALAAVLASACSAALALAVARGALG